jgi:hypothetical protein
VQLTGLLLSQVSHFDLGDTALCRMLRIAVLPMVENPLDTVSERLRGFSRGSPPNVLQMIGRIADDIPVFIAVANGAP